jgi:hypothetical protein
VETIDVPAPDAALEDELVAMVKTQEFAERLYARVVRGTESGNGIESPAARGAALATQNASGVTPAREDAAEEATQPSSSAGVALPSQANQSPVPGQLPRRWSGSDGRPTMVGAGSSKRSLL